MDRKCIIIVSSQDFLYHNISANLSEETYDIRLFNAEEEIENFISNPQRIDALIIDDITYKIDLLSIYSRIFFSFQDLKLKRQILLRKPLILADFLSEIEVGLKSNKIFSVIDGNVYCELRAVFVQKNGEIIKLSQIENLVLKHILLSKDFYISKDILQRDVWKYSKDAQTTTIDQSMQKLRKALPKGLLVSFKNGYKLTAEKMALPKNN